MNYQDRTKEELIIELQKLLHENNSLKESYQKEITSRKKSENAFREGEAKMKSIFRAAPTGIGVIVNRNIRFVNQRFIEMLGYSEKELIGQNSRMVYLTDEEFDRVGKYKYEQIKKYGTGTIETQLVRKDGGIIDILLSSIPIDLNDPSKGITFTATDITDRKKVYEELLIAKERIEKSEKKFRELFEKSGDAILIIENGNFIDCNQSTVEMLGYDYKNDFLTVHPSELSPEFQPDGNESSEKANQMLEIALKLGTHRFEWIHVKRNGDLFPVEVLLTTIVNNDDNKVIHAVWRDISERKHVEKKLNENENIFKLITENSFDFIWTMDMQMNITYASDSVRRLLGYSPAEIRKINVKELYSPEEFKIIQNILAEELAKGNPHKGVIFKAKHLRKDKTEFRVEIQATIIYNDKNEPILIQGYTRDISIQAEAEKKLLRSEERYRMLFDYSPDPIMVHDGSKILDINPATLEAVGLKDKQDLIGRDPFGMIHPEDREKSVQRLEELVKNKKPLKTEEFRFITPQNEIRTVLATPVPVIYDEKQAFMINYHDITERKKADVELQRSEKRFKRLFESLGDAVYVAKIGGENKGQILEANPAAVKQSGYSKTELLKMNIVRDMYVAGSGEINTDDWDSELHSGSIVTTTEKKRRKDGTEYWTEVIVTPFDFKGEKASLSINHDITNRKVGEENLTKALGKATESDRLKSAFLANMSHEIRTPMNGILGFSDLLKDPALSGDEQQEYIKIIEKSGRRMLNTINDIIDISRIEAGQIDVTLSEVNINDQIDYLHTFFRPEAENKNIKLLMKKGLSNEDSIVKTDREKLYSILTNLVKNAIKYSHQGSIEFGYNLKNENEFSELEFYVEDSGIGIPKDRQKAIFGRFIQADIEDKHVYEGSGLGLAISKAYVEMLGGKMSLVSEENIGSKFCFTLPYNFLIKENTITSNEKLTDSIPKIKKLKILIADDEITAEIYLTLVLKNFKDEILFAKTGVEAVEIIRNKPDIDLILMDIRMPEMDGYEATREIRKFNKKVIIIAQTAFGLIGDKERAINAGCDDYISKPIKKNELVALVEKYFKLED